VQSRIALPRINAIQCGDGQGAARWIDVLTIGRSFKHWLPCAEHSRTMIVRFEKGFLKRLAVSRIVIERPHKKCRVTIYSARPGVVIGKKGADIDKIRKLVGKLTGSEVVINIVEVRKPEVEATLVADSIAQQLERRVAFRRAMKRAVQSAMRLGAQGIRINCSGRLAAPRSRASNGIAKVACRCTRCVPMWITASPPRTPPMALAASRSGFSRAKSSSTTRWRKTSVSPSRPAARRPSSWRSRQRPRSRQTPGTRRRVTAQEMTSSNAARKSRSAIFQTACSRAEFESSTTCCNPNAPSPQGLQGRIRGASKGGFSLNFGQFGLKALEPERITARQIEAARRAMTRHMKRAGRVWIRIFPDVPISKKPTEVRMGKGKARRNCGRCASRRAASCRDRRRSRAPGARGLDARRREIADQDALYRAHRRVRI